MQDTGRAASDRYFELLRQAGPQQRLQMCVSLSQTTRELAIAGIRQEHGGRELSDAELRHHLAHRLYGPTVAQRHFPIHRP